MKYIIAHDLGTSGNKATLFAITNGGTVTMNNNSFDQSTNLTSEDEAELYEGCSPRRAS